jgi:putative ABC transport system permease protein
VALVNRAFAERFWPGEDAVGKRIAVGGAGGDGGDGAAWQTVVGVVADVKHRALDGAARPEVFQPYPQLDPGFTAAWARGLSVVVRSGADPGVVAGAVRRTLAEVDRDRPAIRVRPMAELVGDSVAQPRFRTLVLGAFALIALALAATGVFGATAYFAAQRRREVGVRMALGARRRDVLALVLGWGGRLAAVGLALGLAGSLLFTRWMASLLFEVSPTDPATFAAASGLLAAAALAAAFLPARRAAGLDPVAVLRGDDPA